jgi:hypothetical protein
VGGAAVGDGPITAEVAGFIADHVDSVAQLEILLFARAHGADVTPDVIGHELRIDAAWAAAELAVLAARGFMARSENATMHYRFAPQTAALERGVTLLVEAYNQRRVTVVNLIFSKPSRNIRTFADAFRLRKDK